MEARLISDIVLSLTFLAILWYSWETRGLKIQMRRQTELSLRPLVLIDWISSGGYILRNVGNGLALNIQTDDISIVDELGAIYSFKKIDLLTAKDQKDLGILIGERPATGFALGAILPHSAVRDFDYLIRYTDIDGTRYQSSGQIGKSEAIFLSTKRISDAKRIRRFIEFWK
jgi:hypothetical protein